MHQDKEIISVVIPVYNGTEFLQELYNRLKKTLQKLELDFEIIMVDDHSPDDSYQQIKYLSEQDSRVKGIKLSSNFGQQNALMCGFNQVQGDFIVTLDDDLQHKPEDIKELYYKIKEGFEIVYALPRKREYSFWRKLGSRLTNFLFNHITSKPPRLRVSSYRIMTKTLVDKITVEKSNFVYISAILLQYTDNIGNIEVSQFDRSREQSNYNILKLISLFAKLYIYYGNLHFLKWFRKKGNQYEIEETTF